MSDDMPTSAEQPELFEVEPDWKDSWRGMPAYDHQDLQPDQTLLVHFRNEQDRQRFATLIGQTLHARTKFVWHPKAEIGTAADKVFTRGEKVTPRYPVYIISKGRADTRLTSKAFEWLQIPYNIVVEPQEYEQYAAVIDPAKILVLPFSNLGLGGIPARNWVWEHAVGTGALRHWIFDDNVSGFCRFQDNLKVEVDSGILHALIEDFVDRYENVAMAAFNYDYFAPRKQGAKIKPITFNTRCYSGILLRNDLVDVNGVPIRWRGRYNEDTDLSLRILMDGATASTPGRYATALFNAFLMYKKPTLTMKGGNTDQLYAGAEASAAEWERHAAECRQCAECADGYPTDAAPRAAPCDGGRAILSKDGRWLMAESLREQHPEQTTVERKWRRWQHVVDYRRFRDNALILRPDAVIPIDAGDYGMELGKMPEGWGAMEASAKQMKPYTQAAAEPGAALSPISALDFAFRAEAAPASPLAAREGLGKALAPEEKPATGQPEKPAGQPKPEGEPEHAGAVPFKIDLEARGHRLLTRDGKLFISEASRLTQADRDAVQTFKQELIALATPWAEHERRSTDGDVQASARSQPAPDKNEVILVSGIGAQEVDEKTTAAAAVEVVFQAGSEPAVSHSSPVQSIAQFLSTKANADWHLDEPPDLTGIDEVVINFATDGLDWAHGARPVGVTVSTLDGQLTRFLPFGFRGGGNLDEATVKRWFTEQVRGKRITNANTRFDVHMSREWSADLEEQGCTVSDVMHYAALLDDHRKRFALDVLVNDYLPNEPKVERVDEKDHASYAAWDVVEREKHTAQMTAKLRNVMWPLLDAEDLQEVRQLEDEVIFPVCEMERNGALLDLELLEQYHREVKEAHGVLMMELADEAGFAFDGTSKSWQRLFERCNLPPTDSIAEETIGLIDHPLVNKARYAGQLASLDSKTFAAYLKNVEADGTLRFDINQLRGDEGGTVSGRFSIGYVQQVPNHDNHSAVFGERWFPRRLFISKTGSVLEADAAQIEYRLFASDAGNADLLKAYRDDPWASYHKMTWSMMKAYKPDMLYVNQKSFNFARQYGAKMVKLAMMMGFINAREAAEIKSQKRWSDPKLAQIKEIEAAYKRINPEGDKLLDLAAHLAKPECDQWCKRGDVLHRQHKHRGYIKTLSGRRSRFRGYDKHYIALNRRLQGGGADIMKKKLVALHRERKNTGLLLRLTVHDNTLGDAQEGTKDRVEEILNVQSYPTKVPILWVIGIGANWAEAK